MTRKEVLSAALVVLYQKMADLTRPKCGECRVPHSCCEAAYCDIAIQHAKEMWGVELKPTEHKKIPLLGPDNQCTAPPHLRPLCTRHVCSINSVGFDFHDPEWTEKYYELREKIDELEMEWMYGEE